MANEDLGDLTRHAMNCQATVGDGFDGPDENGCNCGLKWKAALATERSMHGAWRKRAEEAEACLNDLRDRIRQYGPNL